MRITVIFKVPGEPVAQARARFARRGNFTVAYDPKKSKTYKEWVAVHAREAFGLPPIENAVRLVIDVYKSVPASWPKKKRAEALSGALLPSVKPDWDNYAKCLCDGMKGVIYKDDSQVVSAEVNKHYSAEPRVEIMVQEVM